MHACTYTKSVVLPDKCIHLVPSLFQSILPFVSGNRSLPTRPKSIPVNSPVRIRESLSTNYPKVRYPSSQMHATFEPLPNGRSETHECHLVRHVVDLLPGISWDYICFTGLTCTFYILRMLYLCSYILPPFSVEGPSFMLLRLLDSG